MPLRPSEPLPDKPAGYLSLESYSSLRRLWTFLDGAERAGRRLSLLRGDHESSARRRVEGYTLPYAGGLLDVTRVEAFIADGFEGHGALLSLAAGDPAPLRATLDAAYDLHASFTLALTARRELILRPELKYRPHGGEGSLPADLPLLPRRFSRDELRYLLERACGLA